MPDGKTTDGSEPFRAMLVEFAESGEAGKVEGLDLDDPNGRCARRARSRR